MKKKHIHIISENYPFGKGEQFFEKEIFELSKYFDRIYLFPLASEGEMRAIPINVEVKLSLANANRKIATKTRLKNIFLLLTVFYFEFFYQAKKKIALKKIRSSVSSFLQAKILSEVFMENVNSSYDNYFYSFWMNDGALMFSILKYQNKISNFLFRVNGYDLFDERFEGGYIPFRYFNFRNAKKIVILSEEGLNYLKRKNIFPEKLVLNYYGIYDNGMNPFDPSALFTIVSCSNMIPLKRVDKIIRTLMLISFPVNWIHFGDGELMEQMKELAKDLPQNIKYSFKGSVNNDIVIDTYKNKSVNMFIHLSNTEGLGLAIIEAQSFGIPAIATAVGGVVNVVNEETGILVALDTPLHKIASKINEFMKGEFNSPAHRLIIKQNWKCNFDAVTNYEKLAKIIISK
ncbi:MAG: glycosyltransferase [Bacteroidetes bacterium]|nr:glycosyltransferase [Bacteroidota bacterium]